MKGDKTLAELAQQYDTHPNQITDWKTQLLERAAQMFDGTKQEPEQDLKALHMPRLTNGRWRTISWKARSARREC